MGTVLPNCILPRFTLQSVQSEQKKRREKASVPMPAWRWGSAEGFVSMGTGSDIEPEKRRTPSPDS